MTRPSRRFDWGNVAGAVKLRDVNMALFIASCHSADHVCQTDRMSAIVARQVCALERTGNGTYVGVFCSVFFFWLAKRIVSEGEATGRMEENGEGRGACRGLNCALKKEQS